MLKRLILCTILLLVSSTFVFAQWIKQDVATTASFRGLSVVNEKVVWASGTGGTVIRTIDGGKKWDVIQVPDAAKLDFRDIEAFDANTAYILSIGNGESSRIYKTTDGGKTWKEQFRNTNNKAFYDAITCWTAKRCIAMSDPVDGHYVLIETLDGMTWNEIKSNDLPAAKDGQAAFAASGTCLITQGSGGMAYLVSGGTDAVVYRSYDYGRKWAAAPTPIVKGTQGSGIFSIAMWNGKVGFIVGGNYEKPNEKVNVAASTSDGGRTWKTVEGLSGYRSAVAYVDAKTLIAVGTNGSDVSIDGGVTWTKSGSEDLNAVAAVGKKAVWAVGPKGTVLRMDSTASGATNQSGPVRFKGCPIGSVIQASSATAKPGDTIRFKFSIKDWNGNRPRYPWAISGGGRIVSGQDSPVIEVKITNEADNLTAVVWLGDDEIACVNHPQETIQVIR